MSSVCVAGALLLAWITAIPPAQGTQPAAQPEFATLGEALSSTSVRDGLEVGIPRMFTIDLLEEACRAATAERVVRLRAEPARLGLRVGEPLALDRLVVVALDRSGAVLPRVPLAVEMTSPTDVFDTRQDVLGSGPMIPLRAGRATFRMRTICPGSSGDVRVHAEVRR